MKHLEAMWKNTWPSHGAVVGLDVQVVWSKSGALLPMQHFRLCLQGRPLQSRVARGGQLGTPMGGVPNLNSSDRAWMFVVYRHKAFTCELQSFCGASQHDFGDLVANFCLVPAQ